MRIRAVVPLYPPHSLVGSWVSTHECLEHMAARGHTVTVTAFLARTALYHHGGVTVESDFRSISAESVGGLPPTDVVIGHVGDDGSSATAARRLGAPLVYMVHGGPRAEIAAKLEGCELAVFNSHALADEVGWRGASVVVHPPVRIERYATTPGDRVTLINLSADKGGGLFWQLARSMRDTPFLGVRGGYGAQVLLAGVPNVILQRVTPDVVAHVYGRTRILLQPSAHETWGRVGLEAACSGIPTIAHPHPGVVEALGDAALYLDRDDIDAWVEAIEVLSDPKVWASASDAARERVKAFDPDEQLEIFESALSEVAGCVSYS